ncbi:nucleoside permease [Balneolaceae bacterium YR4-1]|uniref:Nucleoside permease n=1 Tax=Halalkalibaculum roseum TaxID=2709311 RepID=A0A6M1T8M5_9BACT|nr:MFS transporter [Halalkalibaculum roseum]NGP76613.1 nucleoside permease [Halalkalibaculum roseum]
MNKLIQAKLSTMMFLEFFIWGAWYTAVAVYMTANGMEDLTHWPFTVNPIAAIAAPFFVGLIADRYFATEKVLGTLHILGAAFMFLTPFASDAPLLFILLLLAYNLCYMPTMSLANTLAFHNMEDQEKQFPIIRVFGTVGWIVAGLTVSFVLGAFVAEGLQPEQTAMPLYLASGASLLLGLFSFSLPHTPPPAAGESVSVKSIIGVDALKQLGSKSFYIFLASSLLISIPLAAYYNFTQIFLGATGFENIAATQTIGQMSEVIFMLLMPFFFVRLGVKWMLAAGMLAWVARYALFAMGAPDEITWMIIGGIALHGICYDFFFVTGQIYVDKKSTPTVRGQAQGLIVLITYGVGMLIGAQVAGQVYNSFLGTAEALTLSQWYDFWWIPAIFAAVILLFFVLTFDDKVIEDQEDVDASDFTV